MSVASTELESKAARAASMKSRTSSDQRQADPVRGGRACLVPACSNLLSALKLTAVLLRWTQCFTRRHRNLQHTCTAPVKAYVYKYCREMPGPEAANRESVRSLGVQRMTDKFQSDFVVPSHTP